MIILVPSTDTGYELEQDNLNVGPELLDALRKEKWPVVKYPGYLLSKKREVGSLL